MRSGGGAIVLGPVDTLYTRESSGAGPWKATIDTSGNDVRIRVTGAAATTINWKSWAKFWLMDFA